MNTFHRLLLLSLDEISTSLGSDAVVQATGTASLTANAVAQLTRTAALTSGAIVADEFSFYASVALASDSVVRTSLSVSILSGATVRTARSALLTSGAVVGEVRTASISSSATIRLGRVSTLSSGAVVRSSRATGLTTGAMVWEVPVVLPMVGRVSLTTGAVVADELGVVPTTETMSLNAGAILDVAAVVVPVVPRFVGAIPMIQVTKMVVRSFDLDHLDLYWEIANVAFGDSDQHAIYDYQFLILRAGDSPLGPYDQIGGPLSDTYHFRDISVSLQHKWRQYHYKLRVVHIPTGAEAEFGPTTFEAEQDLIATEVNRLEDMLFREFVGRRCWLYPARTFGPRCSCFDVTLNRLSRANHKPCFGTGFLGGFMSPVEAFVQIDPNPKSTQQTSLQEIQQNDSVARMISFPPVSPRDILVETENRRWKVINVTTTQRLRAVVRQELKIHEIPRGDIEYELPIRVDQRTLVPSAERNFTNPQNLDNDGDYSDILAAYGHARGISR